MPNPQSVTYWIQKLQGGDEKAAEALWQRYYRRLVELARQRLRGAPQRVADEDDVAQGAFDSFFRGAEAGRFPRLDDREDLWQVLMMLTKRKAADQANHERRPKRGGGAVVPASALDGEEGEAQAFAELISREPDPAFAAEVADNCRALLGALRDDTLRAIALGRMEGQTNEEIAGRLGMSVSTVERKLRLIRTTWEESAT